MPVSRPGGLAVFVTLLCGADVSTAGASSASSVERSEKPQGAQGSEAQHGSSDALTEIARLFLPLKSLKKPHFLKN